MSEYPGKHNKNMSAVLGLYNALIELRVIDTQFLLFSYHKVYRRFMDKSIG